MRRLSTPFSFFQVNLAPLLKQYPLSILLDALHCEVSPLQLEKTQTDPSSVWSSQIVSSALGGSRPSLGSFSHTHAPISIYLMTDGVHSAELCDSLCLSLPSDALPNELELQ